MTLTLTFFCGIAATLFNYVGGPVFDMIGPNAPFTLCGIMDITFSVASIILVCCGFLRRKDNSDKSKSQESPKTE